MNKRPQTPVEIDDIPTIGVGQYIQTLAEAHGIVYKREKIEDLAEMITRLSGDEVVLDLNEKLLIRLKKANVITSPQMMRLLHNYMQEKRKSVE